VLEKRRAAFVIFFACFDTFRKKLRSQEEQEEPCSYGSNTSDSA